MLRSITSPSQASLLLLNWKRTQNVITIIEQQKSFESVGEILVFNNNPEVCFEYHDPKVRFLNASADFGLRTRWILAALARHDFLIFQDDDLLLTEDTVEKFIEHLQNDPERVYSLHGRNPDKLGQYNATPAVGEVEIVLTRAAAIHKSVVPLIFGYETAFAEKGFQLPLNNGEDIFLSYCLAAHFGKKPRVLDLPSTDLSSPHAINARSGHLAERTEVVRLCKRFFAL